jgi:hypothetical protein
MVVSPMFDGQKVGFDSPLAPYGTLHRFTMLLQSPLLVGGAITILKNMSQWEG